MYRNTSSGVGWLKSLGCSDTKWNPKLVWETALCQWKFQSMLCGAVASSPVWMCVAICKWIWAIHYVSLLTMGKRRGKVWTSPASTGWHMQVKQPLTHTLTSTHLSEIFPAWSFSPQCLWQCCWDFIQSIFAGAMSTTNQEQSTFWPDACTV